MLIVVWISKVGKEIFDFDMIPWLGGMLFEYLYFGIITSGQFISSDLKCMNENNLSSDKSLTLLLIFKSTPSSELSTILILYGGDMCLPHNPPN